ncbi:MAG: HEAT repeat domain-containing protein [Candidatus Tectomicrobia bacterium]
MSMLRRLRIHRATEALLHSSGTDTPEHIQAIVRLKEIGKPAIPKLIQLLGKMPSSDVLIDLLSAFLDNASLPIFIQGLAYQDTRVVSGIVQVLSRGAKYDPNRLLELFIDPRIPKASVVNILFAHKESLKPKALLELLNVVGKESQGVVFQLLDRVASESMLPQLIPHTEHQDWLIRLHIARTLSRFKTESVRDTLMRLLTDPHKDVRQAALEGLAGLQLPMDIGPICELLRDPDLTVQSKAIETIIQVNDPQAVYHLIDILQEESEYVRRAAVEVLNTIGNTDAIKDLLGALRDKDWWVRVRAADALGNIGGSRVVEAILPLIKDENEFIRRTAVEILNTTKDERAFHYLVEALNDGDWWVQERAIDALANMGDARAVPALLPLLEEDTEKTPAVIRALAGLGDSQAIRPLLAKLQSHHKAVKKEALQALTRLTSDDYAEEVQHAITEAMPALDTENRELAQETVHAIMSRFGDKMCAVAGAFSSDVTVIQHRSMLQEGTRLDGVGSLQGQSPEGGATPSGVSFETPSAEQFIDPMELEQDTVLAKRYRVIGQVGRGAFGVVILVEDMAVHEEIILKFLNPHLAANDEVIRRFVQELRYTRKITHENVIRIYDFVTIGKSFAISMEYFQNHPLASEIMNDTPLLSQRRLRIIHDVCRGMSVAHHATIVHRDLKPQNILVNDDGLVKIVDFGLAAAINHPDSRLTGSGALMGTPTYMAPEQVQGRDIDARTDIYSLGVIMYEMFTGQPPYQGPDAISIMYQHVQGQVTPPRKLNPDLLPALETIILTAMAAEPAERYQNVDVLRKDIEALLDPETG